MVAAAVLSVHAEPATRTTPVVEVRERVDSARPSGGLSGPSPMPSGRAAAPAVVNTTRQSHHATPHPLITTRLQYFFGEQTTVIDNAADSLGSAYCSAPKPCPHQTTMSSPAPTRIQVMLGDGRSLEAASWVSIRKPISRF